MESKPKAKKKSMGRKKIPIEKIQHLNYRQVTFSKRRAGLFKKASELCILCGAEVAIIVFSPAGKAFSFGHPSVDSIIDRFLNKQDFIMINNNNNINNNDNAMAVAKAREKQQQKQYMEVLAQLEMEKKRGEVIEQVKRSIAGGSNYAQYWWDEPIDGLGLEELEERKEWLEKLRDEVARRVHEMAVKREGGSSSTITATAAAATGFLMADCGNNIGGVVDQFVHQGTMMPSYDFVPPYDYGF